jgi:hypothetical protein
MQEWVISIVIILLFGLWLKYYYKEGFDSSPMDVVKTQQGDIETIHNQLLKVTISELGINQIQTEINTLRDQILTLQKNIPDPQIKKYALD